MKIKSTEKNIIIICAALVMIAVAFVFLRADTVGAETSYAGRVEVSALYMRKGPGTDYDNITVSGTKVKLKMEQKVTVYGKVGNWYHISAVFEGKTIEGYSLGTQDGFDWISLETKKKLPEETYIEAYINANTLNVRKGPSITAAKQTVKSENVLLKRDHKVIIAGTADDEDGDPWYHVMTEFNGEVVWGYSLAKYIETTKSGGSGSTSGQPAVDPEKDKKVTPSPTPSTPQSDYSGTEKVKTLTADPNLLPMGIDYDPSTVVPMGYTLVGRTYSSNLNIPATVTANKLNLRELQSMDSEVITVLQKGAELMVLNAFLEDTDDSEVKYRWFKVLTVVDGTYVVGCVRGDFIELDYSKPISVSTRYAGQTVRKKASGKAEEVSYGGVVMKLSKGTVLSIIGETKDADGVKWYHVTGTYGKINIDGYVQSYRFNFTKIAKSFEVFSLSKSTDSSGIGYVAPGTPPVIHTISGYNAEVSNAAGLVLHTEASATSSIRYTSGSYPVMVYTGDKVRISEVKNVDGVQWCRISCSYMNEEFDGYVRSHYLTSSVYRLTDDTSLAASSSTGFEQLLAAEGFPESYKELLRKLHEQYPKWIFKAYDTGLDWSKVIKAESAVGVNLIPNSKSNEWKSFETGAYNWKTDSFVAYDGSTWVTASEKAVAYYMDPRNFLESSAIFQFEILDYNTGYQTLEGIETILRNTALGKKSYSFVDDEGYTRTATYAETILMAAEYTGVSPFHLASRIKQEITSGTDSVSNSVSGTVAGYEGLYNFYNIGAYNSTAAGGAIKNGLRFAKTGSTSESLNKSCMIPWNNIFRSIVGGAYYIGNSYISKGQNTIYLEKFNVTSYKTYDHQYMSNLEAPYSEGRRVASGYEDPGNLPIVFSIPVYRNMPASPASLPSDEDNPNNWLKTLHIIDGDEKEVMLSPAFDPSKQQEYSISVKESAAFIRFKTETVSSSAHVTTSPITALIKGNYKFVIVVAAENGDEREYIINISCK